MLDVKKTLAKLLGAISTIKGDITTINSKLTVTTPSISITATTGTFGSASVRKYGNVVLLMLQVRNTSSVASGGNLFVGTINTSSLRPLAMASSGTYFGNHALMGLVGTAGSLTIRNASNSAVTVGSSDLATISFTYIVA